MMVRIRVRGKGIGQVSDALLEEYKKIEPYKKLNLMAEAIISREILHYPIQGLADLTVADGYVKNLHYRNIGEFLDAYIRNRLMNYFPICGNCEKCEKKNNNESIWRKTEILDPKECICKKKGAPVNRLESACEDFALKKSK